MLCTLLHGQRCSDLMQGQSASMYAGSSSTECHTDRASSTFHRGHEHGKCKSRGKRARVTSVLVAFLQCAPGARQSGRRWDGLCLLAAAMIEQSAAGLQHAQRPCRCCLQPRCWSAAQPAAALFSIVMVNKHLSMPQPCGTLERI